jgi:hypothetical protein
MLRQRLYVERVQKQALKRARFGSGVLLLCWQIRQHTYVQRRAELHCLTHVLLALRRTPASRRRVVLAQPGSEATGIACFRRNRVCRM